MIYRSEGNTSALIIMSLKRSPKYLKLKKNTKQLVKAL